MEAKRKELPKKWVTANMGEMFLIERGGSPRPIKDYITYEKDGLNWIKIGDTDQSSKYIYRTKEKIKPEGEKKSRMVFEGDFLLSNSMSFGRPFISKIQGCIHDGWLVIRKNNKISTDYLYYSLSSPDVKEQFVSLAKGSTVKNLNIQAVQKVNFPLPPLPEQERIVAKLDTLFGSLEQLNAGLDKIPTLLKNFKQAVLTQAVTGKLTKEWRVGKELESGKQLLKDIENSRSKLLLEEIHNGKNESKRILRKLEKLEYSKPDEVLPNNWIWSCFLESCFKVVDCHNKTAPYVDDGISLLRTTNIKSGKIKLEGSKYITEETYKFWSKRCPPEPNDILFTREAPMGEAAIIPEGMKVCMGQRMMLLRPLSNLISSQYILLNILSFPFQERMISNAIGTGVKHLRVGDVERLTFPIPPKEEQTEIVNRVESLFARAEVLEARYHALKEKVSQLPQAILAKAFKGELVEQLESDGDAKELLKEILELKAATATASRASASAKKRASASAKKKKASSASASERKKANYQTKPATESLNKVAENSTEYKKK